MSLNEFHRLAARMTDGRVWVVGAQDGVVIRDTDGLLSNDDAQKILKN
ncbi:hypothetical protein PS928_06623 [Pseudomonas fluorescens]|uniref:Uncharacterized protein n=2 Tax=Pseudomonas fluorescens TaxID=294 RepID=A0A5E7VUE4_PSEFL|nr:hypothetical protein PS928_06623 [Pseudomonas fluorescens]